MNATFCGDEDAEREARGARDSDFADALGVAVAVGAAVFEAGGVFAALVEAGFCAGVAAACFVVAGDAGAEAGFGAGAGAEAGAEVAAGKPGDVTAIVPIGDGNTTVTGAIVGTVGRSSVAPSALPTRSRDAKKPAAPNAATVTQTSAATRREKTCLNTSSIAALVSHTATT